MKKIVVLTSTLIALLVFAAVGSAITINAGPFGAKFLDQTFADLNYPLVSNGALGDHPLQTAGQESGNIWGIVSMTGIYTLLDGNPENNALDGVAYYTPGSDGKYYFAVYGGLNYMSGSAPGETRYGAASYAPYLNIYETTDPTLYGMAYLAGPNVAGAGALGTFGVNIIYGADGIASTADDPTLYLATTFSPLTLAAYDVGYQAGELELITNSNSVTGSAEAYLDILGGTGAALFETGVFPMGAPAFPFRADLKVISDLTQQYNVVQQRWTNSLWTTSSQDPITGVGIPEPGTLVLLGIGLFGIGIVGKKRIKK